MLVNWHGMENLDNYYKEFEKEFTKDYPGLQAKEIAEFIYNNSFSKHEDCILYDQFANTRFLRYRQDYLDGHYDFFMPKEWQYSFDDKACLETYEFTGFIYAGNLFSLERNLEMDLEQFKQNINIYPAVKRFLRLFGLDNTFIHLPLQVIDYKEDTIIRPQLWGATLEVHKYLENKYLKKYDENLHENWEKDLIKILLKGEEIVAKSEGLL